MVRDKSRLTEWKRNNMNAITKHRSQDVSTKNKSFEIAGYSVFGIANNIPAISKFTNSSYTLGLSPAALLNGNFDEIADRALLVGGNFLSRFINESAIPPNRDYLENFDTDMLYSRSEGFRLNQILEKVGYIGFAIDNNQSNFNGIFDREASVEMPIHTDSRDGYSLFKVPFYENPKITESRKPNYAKHPIVNRNEPYRLWTGSEPMSIDIKFSLTLPHLITFAHEQLKKTVISSEFKRNFTDWLLHTANRKQNQVEPEAKTPGDGLEYVFDKINQVATSEGNPIRDFIAGDASLDEDVYRFAHKTLTNLSESIGRGTATNNAFNRGDIILYCMGLITLIRTSVMGHRPDSADAPTYVPPPVAFLKFGSLYQDFPCIVTGYNITFDGKAGYEEVSLLPRVIDISLKLESYHQFSTEGPFGNKNVLPAKWQGPKPPPSTNYTDAKYQSMVTPSVAQSIGVDSDLAPWQKDYSSNF